MDCTKQRHSTLNVRYFMEELVKLAQQVAYLDRLSALPVWSSLSIFFSKQLVTQIRCFGPCPSVISLCCAPATATVMRGLPHQTPTADAKQMIFCFGCLSKSNQEVMTKSMGRRRSKISRSHHPTYPWSRALSCANRYRYYCTAN
jgi:hypothetical protein